MKRWRRIAYAYAILFCVLYLQHYHLEHVLNAQPVYDRHLIVLSASSALQDSARFQTAQKMFSKMHPDVGVEIQVANKDLADLLSSGSQGADLMYGMNLLPEFFDDLRVYDEIMAEMEAHWIDVGAMRDGQGRIFCLPDSASLQRFSSLLFVRDAGALADAGISVPENGFSYAQFRILGERAKQAGYPLLAMDTAAAHILDTFHALCPGASYDSHEFRTALSFWKEMHEAGYVVFAYDVNRTDALLTCSCASAKDPDGNWIERKPAAVFDGQTVPFPTEQGREQAFVPLWAWYMPKDCAQKDLAADLLACLASADAQKELEEGRGGMLLSDMKAYDRWRWWTWQQVSGFYAYPGLDSEGYPHWVGMLEQSAYAPMRHPLRERFAELLPKYLSGEIVSDELVLQMMETEETG